MNKTELIAQVAGKTGLSKSKSRKAVNAMLAAVQAGLSEDEEVIFPGFCVFTVGIRAGRRGRNPRTGEIIHIPAARVVKFTPGRKLREAAARSSRPPASGEIE